MVFRKRFGIDQSSATKFPVGGGSTTSNLPFSSAGIGRWMYKGTLLDEVLVIVKVSKNIFACFQVNFRQLHRTKLRHLGGHFTLSVGTLVVSLCRGTSVLLGNKKLIAYH